jgi:AcrR family transcriptional regulator
LEEAEREIAGRDKSISPKRVFVTFHLVVSLQSDERRRQVDSSPTTPARMGALRDAGSVDGRWTASIASINAYAYECNMNPYSYGRNVTIESIRMRSEYFARMSESGAVPHVDAAKHFAVDLRSGQQAGRPLRKALGMKTNRSSGQPTKHQIKTEATLRGLLEAAETIFVRDGYERAQIETIAAEAGRTKGAIYAHFQSKEDIFFALLERRIKSRQEALLNSLRDLPFQRQIEVIRESFLSSSKDESWHILMLEFKLFALRNKASARRMRELYLLLYESVAHSFLSQARGLTDVRKDRMLMGFALLRGIPSAVVLEKQFYPVLSSPDAKDVLAALFDSLVGCGDLVPRRKSGAA